MTILGDNSSFHHAVDAGAADLPADAQLYLRHIENGETIRALARELGCHASTVMRRIRRFEARRDDPLIDSALDHVTPRHKDDARERQQTIRILRRLAESGAQMIVGAGMDKAIVVRDDIRTAILDHSLAEKMALNGWVAQVQQGRVAHYALAPAGREALRSLLQARQNGAGAAIPQPQRGDFVAAEAVAGMAEAPSPFAEAHRVYDDAMIEDPEDGTRRRVRINIAESPLQLLARRRDVDGKPFLAPDLVAAAERLREDFELSQIGPRMAQNWDRFLTAGIDASPIAGRFEGGSDRARDRVAEALRELGPGMGDLVLRVCCFLEGIEATERRLGWSARSGKIVLRLALERLHRHYLARYGAGQPLVG